MHVVSDVHGNAEALARAGDGADALLVLGDMIDFVDHDDPTAGVLGDVVGPEASETFSRLRAAGRPGEMRAFVTEMWSRVPDPAAAVEDAVRKQYDRLFAALPAPAWLIPGNVDVPTWWPDTPPGVRVPVDETVELGGLVVGFVGGVPLPAGLEPRRRIFPAHMRGAGEYTRAVEALGRVDLLCSHAPPAVPELAYDVVARSKELSSPALLEAVHEHRPRVALFGHVHAPLVARVRVGDTECVNVGHFQRRGTPCVVRW